MLNTFLELYFYTSSFCYLGI
ncbi:hypothetical protein LINPERPRIM_LOCUS7706 [Linum perenne]